jgi:hypothetical protein
MRRGRWVSDFVYIHTKIRCGATRLLELARKKADALIFSVSVLFCVILSGVEGPRIRALRRAAAENPRRLVALRRGRRVPVAPPWNNGRDKNRRSRSSVEEPGSLGFARNDTKRRDEHRGSGILRFVLE